MFSILYKTYERTLLKSQEIHMLQMIKSFSERFGKPPLVFIQGNRTSSYRRFYIAVRRDGRAIVINDPFGIEGRLELKKGVQEIEGEHYLVVEIKRGSGVYYVASNVSPVITAISHMKKLGTLLTLIGISLSFLVGYLMSKFSLRPMRNLVKELSKINACTLDIRLENPQTGDEMEELVEEINSMLDRIEEAYRSQERFVHDVSHELRNPLASLKGFVKILRRFGCKNEELFEESISEISELTDEMVSIVENLLTLARSDRTFEVERINVVSIVRDTVSRIKNTFKNREIIVEELAKPVLETSPDLFQLIIKNLLENALKYSPEEEPVFIRINENSVEISDRGPGIPESEREKIFERFYRIDSSRDRRKGGHGLGLAIVKELTQKLGFRIELESEVGKGSTFRVVWKT